MAMFDSIIAEADEKFNLDGKAGILLSALLALMTEKSQNGLAGFLEKFDKADLSEAASSWVGTGANTEISNEQLESALGTETLQGFAGHAHIDYEAATSATAFMIPRVIDSLTPDGILPESGDLISKIGGFLNDTDETISGTAAGAPAAETVDRIGTAAVSESDAEKTDIPDTNVVDRVSPSANDKVNESLNPAEDNYEDSPLKWILPLILLGLLLVLGYWFCSKPPAPAEPAANTNASQANTANQ